MEVKNIHFHEHIFFFILVPLIIVVVVISYYRFFINHDYFVRYEGVCDPFSEKCFVGCEDDECTKEYYYSEVVKYVPDLYKECGKDVTDCEDANVCLPEDRECSVTYCDPEIDGDVCKTVIDESNIQGNDQETSGPIEESLQDNINETNI